VLRDHLAIDANPLAEVHQVGRRIRSDAVAAGPQQRFERGDDAPLAVRAGNVKAVEPEVGVAEQQQQLARALQSEFCFARRPRE